MLRIIFDPRMYGYGSPSDGPINPLLVQVDAQYLLLLVDYDRWRDKPPDPVALTEALVKALKGGDHGQALWPKYGIVTVIEARPLMAHLVREIVGRELGLDWATKAESA